MPEQGIVLKYETNMAVFNRLISDLVALQKYIALVGLFQTGNNAQQSGFTAAGRSQQGDQFTFGNVKIDIIQRGKRAEMFTDMVYGNTHDGFLKKSLNANGLFRAAAAPLSNPDFASIQARF